jgi:hypothetical protein
MAGARRHHTGHVVYFAPCAEISINLVCDGEPLTYQIADKGHRAPEINCLPGASVGSAPTFKF